MARSPEFKREAVHGLRCVNEFGYYYTVNETRVESVRALLRELGISSSTLYRWDESIESLTLVPDLYEPEEGQYGEEVSVLSYSEKEIREIEEQEESWQSPIIVEPDFKDMYIKIDNTFLMSFARGLGLPNYRVSQSQLFLKLGVEMIKRSGLIDTTALERLRL